ncbi:hypothetical protein P4501_21785 [Bacillus thuringiensis]|nr:hypothetical protein [Bacillus thuringiensis]
MAIEAHKCNVIGCSGLVVFENADFDFHNPETIKGVYAFDNLLVTFVEKSF